MPVAWRLMGAAFAMLMAMSGGNLAFAQRTIPSPVLLSNFGVSGKDVFSYDGLQFTASSCSFSTNGGTSFNSCTTTNLPNDEIEATSESGGANLEVLNSTGSNVLSTGNDIIKLQLSVSDTGGTNVNKISNAVSGTASTNSYVFNKITATTPSPSQTDSAYLNTPSSVTLPGNETSFSVTFELGLANHTGLTLTNAMLVFYPAPEPASIAVVVTALAGLGTVRRRSKRGRLTTVDSNEGPDRSALDGR